MIVAAEPHRTAGQASATTAWPATVGRPGSASRRASPNDHTGAACPARPGGKSRRSDGAGSSGRAKITAVACQKAGEVL